MSEILKSMIGMEVKVYTGETGTYNDEGVLENVDEHVIVLRVGRQPLVFPIYMIRLIKPLN